MNFSTMEYFIAVAEEKNFTKASERLGITQQALSASIAHLECYYRVRLFKRSTPLELTYAGTVFLEYARKAEALERSMNQDFRDIVGDSKGVLRVGISGTRSRIIMPQAIATYQQKRPGIEIELHEIENDELIENLRAGQLDLIVATIPKDLPDIIVKGLYKEEVILLLSKELLSSLYEDKGNDVVGEIEQTGSLRPLADCPFVLLGKQDIPGNLACKIFREAGITPPVRAMSSNSETLLNLCERSVGAFLCPRRLVLSALSEESLDKVRIVHLGAQAKYWISVGWRDTDHVWSATEVFIDTLEEQMDSEQYEANRTWF